MQESRHNIATRQQALGAVLSLRDRHDRQRELVRASLIARPAAQPSTHRRAA